MVYSLSHYFYCLLFEQEAPQDENIESEDAEQQASEDQNEGDGDREEQNDGDANGDADDEEAVVLGDEFQTIDETSQDDGEEGWLQFFSSYMIIFHLIINNLNVS